MVFLVIIMIQGIVVQKFFQTTIVKKITSRLNPAV